jgi:hypothetical protein
MANMTPARIAQMFDKAMRRFAREGFFTVRNAVMANLTGAVLYRDTGNLIANVDLNSRVTPVGFYVGTNVWYGILWERGWTRAAKTIQPKKRGVRALKIPVGSSMGKGKVGRAFERASGLKQLKGSRRRGNLFIFRRRVFMTARTFAPRSFLESAITSNKLLLQGMLARAVGEEANKLPDIVVRTRLFA